MSGSEYAHRANRVREQLRSQAEGILSSEWKDDIGRNFQDQHVTQTLDSMDGLENALESVVDTIDNAVSEMESLL